MIVSVNIVIAGHELVFLANHLLDGEWGEVDALRHQFLVLASGYLGLENVSADHDEAGQEVVQRRRLEHTNLALSFEVFDQVR